MNKSPLTPIVTAYLRGASFLALVFIAINMVRLAQGQLLTVSNYRRFKDNRKSSR